MSITFSNTEVTGEFSKSQLSQFAETYSTGRKQVMHDLGLCEPYSSVWNTDIKLGNYKYGECHWKKNHSVLMERIIVNLSNLRS